MNLTGDDKAQPLTPSERAALETGAYAGSTPAPAKADQALDLVLLKVGRLNYTWTNTESLLIHVLAGLLGTDKEAATIVFLTLNTTRARIDLVERLAKRDGQKAALKADILAATAILTKEAALRNRYNHCIYAFEPETGGISTILMRIQDRKSDIRMGKSQKIDAQELDKLDEAIARLQALNHQVWHIIKHNGFPM